MWRIPERLRNVDPGLALQNPRRDFSSSLFLTARRKITRAITCYLGGETYPNSVWWVRTKLLKLELEGRCIGVRGKPVSPLLRITEAIPQYGSRLWPFKQLMGESKQRRADSFSGTIVTAFRWDSSSPATTVSSGSGSFRSSPVPASDSGHWFRSCMAKACYWSSVLPVRPR
jgi:hypothetical protein